MSGKSLQDYWKKNLTYVGILLAIWVLVSYGAGIVFAPALNKINLFGFQLGFWFAQQGSMIIFVFLIIAYVWLMDRLDEEFDVHED